MRPSRFDGFAAGNWIDGGLVQLVIIDATTQCRAAHSRLTVVVKLRGDRDWLANTDNGASGEDLIHGDVAQRRS